MTKTYKIQAECTNCGAKPDMTVVWGKPIKNIPCPSCGCIKLVAALGRAWRRGVKGKADG